MYMEKGNLIKHAGNKLLYALMCKQFCIVSLLYPQTTKEESYNTYELRLYVAHSLPTPINIIHT